MKKTQLKDANRNIKKRIVSYLSVCLIIMLGCGGFLTTRFMEASLGREAASYEMSHNFKNFEMISSLGLSDSNIEDIKQIEGVEDAEGVMIFTATIAKGHSKRTATVVSETKKISVPELVDGRMPTAENELALAEDFSEKSGIKIGDKVKLQIKIGDMDYPFHTHRFVITGLVRHPDYIHRKLSNVVVAPLASYDEEATDGYYTRAFVKSADPGIDEFYSDKYLEESQPLYDRLEVLAKEFEIKRAEEFKADANAKIDEEWEKALAKFAESQGKIDNGRNKLNSTLAKNRKKLNGYQKKLNEEAAKYEKKLKDSRAKLDKVKKYCKELDKRLPGIKKKIRENRETYIKNIETFKTHIKTLDNLIKELEEGALSPEKEAELLEELEKTVETLETTKKTIEDIQEWLNKTDRNEIVDFIKEATDDEIDPTEVIEEILEFDTSELQDRIDEINALIDKIKNRENYLEEAKAVRKKLNDAINMLENLLKELDRIEESISEYEKKKDAYIARAEKKWKSYKDLFDRKKKEYQDKIDEGWNKYYAAKRKYEDKLDEAVALLAENREKAEKKIKEAREEVDKVECKWLTLDRKSNPGYLDLKSQLATLHRMGTVFGIMFLLITAMVCLSTLMIIIEEQKKMIGTTKAFGFRKKEVLGKYLLFGVSAAIVGNIMAFAAGTGLTAAVLKVYASKNMYPLDNLHTIIRPGATLIISLAMIAICTLASVIACTDILKSPASMLMKGESISGNRAANRKKKESSQKGSLYSKLIIRNMRDDKARVIVSTVIVAACCLLMGLGITLRMSFSDTLDKQGSEINNFDLRVDFTRSVSKEDRAAIDKVIADSGAEYIEAMYENRIYRGTDGIGALNVVCAEADEIEDYIGFALNGKNVEPPEDGILLPAKMGERYSLSPGDSLTIFDDDVEGHDVKIEGFYNCYFGRMTIITPKAYKKYFGEEAQKSSRYIHLNGVDSKELRKAILAVNGNVSFDTPTSFRSSVEAIVGLMDLITYITTVIAILMSFMILTNLANIYLTRKKTELSVMRVNGFSIRQTRGYLARESVITTMIGLVAGVGIGSLASSIAIRMIEPIEMQFDRSYQWQAWVIAAALEGLFALIIYTSTFRKVKNLNLRDIA